MNDVAAGMVGIVGATAMIGVGTAAGMAAVRMVDRMGKQAQRKKRKRSRSRR